MTEQRPQIIVPAQTNENAGDAGEGEQAISQPAKLIRIASMIRELVEEVRQSPLDDQGRSRITEVYGSAIDQLKDALSGELREEIDALMRPLEAGSSESEIRVAQAQLLGWLEGLFHGIQAALWAQHMQAQAAVEEFRRRQLPTGLPGHPGPPQEAPAEGQGTPGQYL